MLKKKNEYFENILKKSVQNGLTLFKMVMVKLENVFFS